MKTIGVIGGSGLYEIEGLENIEEVSLDTPFGKPSDNYIVGDFGDVKMVFLSRHGRGHRLLPSELNFRANIFQGHFIPIIKRAFIFHYVHSLIII